MILEVLKKTGEPIGDHGVEPAESTMLRTLFSEKNDVSETDLSQQQEFDRSMEIVHDGINATNNLQRSAEKILDTLASLN